MPVCNSDSAVRRQVPLPTGIQDPENRAENLTDGERLVVGSASENRAPGSVCGRASTVCRPAAACAQLFDIALKYIRAYWDFMDYE